MQLAGGALNTKRASIAFLLAYVAITILGTMLSLGLQLIRHTSWTAEPLQNTAYLLSERFLPLLNLLVWLSATWLYSRNDPQGRLTPRDAVALGLFWLAIALPLDFVAFVLIRTPLSLSPHDFYIGQFPWIYLIYLAVAISPLCYMWLHKLGKKPEH
jgi:hypothetical protein